MTANIILNIHCKKKYKWESLAIIRSEANLKSINIKSHFSNFFFLLLCIDLRGWKKIKEGYLDIVLDVINAARA